MPFQFPKLWLQKTQNQGSINRALQTIEQTGNALPCSVVAVNGSLVTVKFEVNSATWTLPQVTIPKAESRWIRTPIQVGDFGLTVPSDVYVGGISGQGNGIAKLVRRGNLSDLMFLPCGSSSFPAVNVNQAYVSGPQGVLLETEDHKASILINESGITLTFNGQTITFNASGLTSSVATQVNSTITASGTIDSTGGDVKAGSISLTNHVHTGVQSGSSNTGPATG